MKLTYYSRQLVTSNNFISSSNRPRFFNQGEAPAGFWKSTHNQREFFDWLGKEIGVKELDDWYAKATRKVITDHGGSTLIGYYSGAWIAALKACYPEHKWVSWNTKRKEIRQQAQQQKRVERGKQWRTIFEAQNKTTDDWYRTSLHSLDNQVVQIVNTHFKGSLYKALSAIFPETRWVPWKFMQKIRAYGYWQHKATHRKFFDELGKQVGIQTLDDWYEKLSRGLIIENHGGTLLALYNGSAIAALKAVYPEHTWDIWKFKFAAKNMWNSEEIIGKFLAQLAEKLSIETLDDWYRVDWIQLSKHGAESLLRKHKGLYEILKKQYPHHPWDPKKFSHSKKGQRSLVVTLKKIFPEEEIIEDYIHPKSTFATSNRPMQLDVFIPSKSLAFEYQGQQHYQDVGILGSSNIYRRRDNEKRIFCEANNIKLVEVPYWWNRTQSSLQNMIESGQQLAEQ